jgi:uncharacterized membrane protein
MIRILRNLTWLAGGVALAALVHIAAVLLVPALVTNDAWTRLGRFQTGEGLQALPAATARATPIRMADPATVVLVCRYDLDDEGPIRVTGRANVPYWGLSLHNKHGAAYYAINNRALAERPLELRVMTADDVTRFRADLPEDAEQELLIAAPEAQGFVLIRALVPEPSSRPRIEAEMAKLACAPSTT